MPVMYPHEHITKYLLTPPLRALTPLHRPPFQHPSVLSSAERHTIAGLILQRMAWEEGTLVRPPRAPAHLSLLTSRLTASSSFESSASSLLDSMVLQVKGLREAISVRCLCAK